MMTVLYLTILSLYFDCIFNATKNIAQTWALNQAPKHPKKAQSTKNKSHSQAESVGWKSLSPRKGFKKQVQAAVAWMNGDEIDTAVTWAEMALISTGSVFSSSHSGSAGSRAFALFSCDSSQMSSAQWWLSPAQAENIQINHLVTPDCRTFVSHTSIFIKTHLLDTHNE